MRPEADVWAHVVATFTIMNLKIDVVLAQRHVIGAGGGAVGSQGDRDGRGAAGRHRAQRRKLELRLLQKFFQGKVF
jgi:hypothetical protein